MSLTRVILALSCLAAVEAHAYPQFQLTTDNPRCGACHLSPAGGGLISEWGRNEAADTISQTDSYSFLGDPRPLNGLWEPPDWFKFGGDFRGALPLVKSASGEETRVLAFPMQADLYTYFKIWKVSLNIALGVRGAARPEDAPPFSRRFVSREHFIMWNEDDDDGGYFVRLGRFFAPYGLRVHDHTAYIRRRLGFNTLEEPYALSVGYSESKDDLAITAFVPSKFFQSGARPFGAAINYERRVGESSAIGAQGKASFTGDSHRYIGGVIAKHYWKPGRLLFMGEFDLGVQSFQIEADAPRQLQMAAYAGVTYVPKNYLMIGSVYEHYDNDVRLIGSGRDSVNFTIQYFPKAHWEVHWLSKWELQGGEYGSQFHMLMLHYYL